MSNSLNQTNSKTESDKKTLLNRLGFQALESSEGRIWTSSIYSYYTCNYNVLDHQWGTLHVI